MPDVFTKAKRSKVMSAAAGVGAGKRHSLQGGGVRIQNWPEPGRTGG